MHTYHNTQDNINLEKAHSILYQSTLISTSQINSKDKQKKGKIIRTRNKNGLGLMLGEAVGLLFRFFSALVLVDT